jgi:drug/metabolite transporter (DMT)-like permease
MISGYRRGILYAALTAVMWGGSGPFVKMISAEGLSQATVSAVRAWFVVASVGLWLRHRRGPGVFRISRRTLAAYAVMGFLSVICMATGYMMSCVYLTVPQAVILHYTFPLLTIAGDCFITKERPTLLQLAAALLILAGLYAGFAMGHGLGAVSVVGALWGALSVTGFAGQNLLTRSILKGGGTDPIVQLFYVNLFGGLMLIAGKSAIIGWGDLRLITSRTALLMVYPVLVTGLIGFALLFSSMKYIPATAASLVCSLEVVSTLALMPLLLGSFPTIQETAGALIILFAVIISTVRRRPAS